jgi:hypothetical protein
MSAIVIYESLTGNTRKAASNIADELVAGGVGIEAVCAVTGIDFEALARADLVVFGTWVDGLILFGQRPGGRVRRVPAMAGKRAAAFCTYAVDPGHTLAKMDLLLADRGAEPLGGFAINRRKLVDGSKEFVDRLLGVVQP